ncbi:MAG: hypothetical protein LH624_14875, partial [Cryobacterium sp.]|nr:hypothetical protein [Cryobacterium sp.]
MDAITALTGGDAQLAYLRGLPWTFVGVRIPPELPGEGGALSANHLAQGDDGGAGEPGQGLGDGRVSV